MHYQMVVAVLRAAARVNCNEALKFYKIEGGSGNFACHDAMIMTSLPAKKRISFVIEKSSYGATVVIGMRRYPADAR